MPSTWCRAVFWFAPADKRLTDLEQRRQASKLARAARRVVASASFNPAELDAMCAPPEFLPFDMSKAGSTWAAGDSGDLLRNPAI